MLGGIGFKELLVILGVVVLVFGTKRIATLGKDMGEAVRGFRWGFKDVKQVQQDLNETVREFNEHDSTK